MNTTIDYDSLTLKDYLNELPPTNQLKWQPKNKTLANGKIIQVSGYMTNCVADGHDDYDPSLHLYEGDTKIVHHCYSCGNRDSINRYFHNKVLKRFNPNSSYDGPLAQYKEVSDHKIETIEEARRRIEKENTDWQNRKAKKAFKRRQR